jgi:hypothetical protein
MHQEGASLIIPRARPPQLAVGGLLERPIMARLDARD